MADGRVPLARQRPFENRCRGGERLEVAVGEEWRSFVHATIVAAPSDTRRQSAPVTPASRRREPELLRGSYRRPCASGHRPSAQGHQPLVEGLRLLLLPGARGRLFGAVIALEAPRRRPERRLILGERRSRL